MDNNLKIGNEHLKFKKVSLVAPSKSFYRHIAAEIDYSPFPFFLTTSAKKKSIIWQSKEWCRQLETEEGVISAVVFKATLIPPGKGKFLKERLDTVQLAKYDFAILIEVSSADKIIDIMNSNSYKQIEANIKKVAKLTHVITAINVKKIDTVNHKKQGVFLFNYFYADNLQQNIDVWEYTAGWFQQETGLNNSTVLLPQGNNTSKYTIINHCRWGKMSDILPSLLFKKSFHSYVLDNFYLNKVAAMPILYKIA